MFGANRDFTEEVAMEFVLRQPEQQQHHLGAPAVEPVHMPAGSSMHAYGAPLADSFVGPFGADIARLPFGNLDSDDEEDETQPAKISDVTGSVPMPLKRIPAADTGSGHQTARGEQQEPWNWRDVPAQHAARPSVFAQYAAGADVFAQYAEGGAGLAQDSNAASRSVSEDLAEEIGAATIGSKSPSHSDGASLDDDSRKRTLSAGSATSDFFQSQSQPQASAQAVQPQQPQQNTQLRIEEDNAQKLTALRGAIFVAQKSFVLSLTTRGPFTGKAFIKKDTKRAEEFKMPNGLAIGLTKAHLTASFDDLIGAVQSYLEDSDACKHITANRFSTHFAQFLMLEINELFDLSFNKDEMAHPNKNKSAFLERFKGWYAIGNSVDEKVVTTGIANLGH